MERLINMRTRIQALLKWNRCVVTVTSLNKAIIDRQSRQGFILRSSLDWEQGFLFNRLHAPTDQIDKVFAIPFASADVEMDEDAVTRAKAIDHAALSVEPLDLDVLRIRFPGGQNGCALEKAALKSFDIRD